MKKLTYLAIFLAIAMISCQQKTEEKMVSKDSLTATNPSNISADIKSSLVNDLVKKFSDTEKFRIEKGVNQAASFWTENDGTPEEFKKFCFNYFEGGEAELDKLFARLSDNFELLFGSYNKIGIQLKMPIQLSNYELLPVDEIFGGYSPGAHFSDDMFNTKLAFVVLLNFPFYSLQEKIDQGMDWSSKQWAYARMGEVFTSRTPARLVQNYETQVTAADSYISNYNIIMDKLRDDQGRQLFPDGLRLISHWGIRDELKAHYTDPEGLDKQRMIFQVMLRIINQDIPQEVINNSEVEWNPFKNEVYKGGQQTQSAPEPDVRYQHLLDNFKALKAMDPYNPFYPNYISRKFDGEMEIPQAEVEKLFTELVSSPVLKDIGQLISTRLGRPLEPFDIWYTGFMPGGAISEDELNKITRAKYPTFEAFQADLVNILTKLGFSSEKASYLSSQVIVDPSRGAGHASGAAMKSDKARLRTRVGADGMDYKGYNIAVHEFGHNVEQTISLQQVDYYMLNGVPNTGFTEGLAFLFQKRNLELLGLTKEDENSHYLEALENIWSNYEIMGVSLVEMQVWKWLYDNPGATAAQLKAEVLRIAKETWNAYYAPVFGVKDSPILAIYSHMIDYPLYLSAYPIGELIQFQVEGYMKGKDFAREVERIYSMGRLVPDVWMKRAVGESISIDPALDGAKEAVLKLK